MKKVGHHVQMCDLWEWEKAEKTKTVHIRWEAMWSGFIEAGGLVT